MRVDVVCADPVFLDLTFVGLKRLPSPGSEYFADALHESPGGAAITAIGLTRLGLHVAVTAPLGDDVAGQTIRRLLEAERVACEGGSRGPTPVTVVAPVDGDRAMMSYAPRPAVDTGAIERLRPRAVVVNAERADAVPPGPTVYAVLGHPEADRLADAPIELTRACALIANRSEAARLSGHPEPEAAAVALAELVPTAVVTCGRDGAVAATGTEVLRAATEPSDGVDTTGAGDLFAAAYVWGDLAGLALGERLRRATLYASLSVEFPTGAAGAATLEELESALEDTPRR